MQCETHWCTCTCIRLPPGNKSVLVNFILFGITLSIGTTLDTYLDMTTSHILI